MKKMIFLIFVGSIITAQHPSLNRSAILRKILDDQNIQTMIPDHLLSRSFNVLDEPDTGRPIKTVNQIWNNNEWQNNTMTEYIYAPAKTQAGALPGISEIYYYLWVGGAWNDIGHDDFIYDPQGDLYTIILYDSNNNSYGRWTFPAPFVDGNPTMKVYEYYNNGWVDSWRYTYYYDYMNCLVEEIWELWNGNGNVFENIMRIQYNYTQACCTDRWVFSSWTNNAWMIYYMADFPSYSSVNCMTDMVPYFSFYFYWWYIYTCNPVLVTMGPTADGFNMLSIESTEEFTHDLDTCLLESYSFINHTVGPNIQQSTTFYYDTVLGKLLATHDNSNQRLTSQVTQTRLGNDLVDNNRTWYSYEGLDLATDTEIRFATDFELKQNYPNPFNPNTTIHYALVEGSDVSITVFDIDGRKINNLISSKQSSGSHSIRWNGTDQSGSPVSAGIYFYRLKAGDFVRTKKMLFMK